AAGSQSERPVDLSATTGRRAREAVPAAVAEDLERGRPVGRRHGRRARSQVDCETECPQRPASGTTGRSEVTAMYTPEGQPGASSDAGCDLLAACGGDRGCDVDHTEAESGIPPSSAGRCRLEDGGDLLGGQ